MTADREVEQHLESLGSESGPPLDGAFADRLDAHLRVMHVEQLSRPRRRSMRVPALAAVAVLTFAVAGAIVVNRSASSGVVMTVASDTDVYFSPDRATIGSPGLRLTDGDRIVVGADGRAVVGGVILAPGSEAVVVGDHIDVVVPETADPVAAGREDVVDPQPSDEPTVAVPPTSARPAPSTAAPTAPTGAPDRSTAGGSVTAAPEPVRTTSVPAPTTTTTTRPTTIAAPASRPDSTPSTRTSPKPTDARPSITLTVGRAGERRLRLDWVVDRDVSPAGWRIRAQRGDRVETVVVIRGRLVRSAIIERATVSGTRMWVEAIDGTGRPLAVSNSLPIR